MPKYEGNKISAGQLYFNRHSGARKPSGPIFSTEYSSRRNFSLYTKQNRHKINKIYLLKSIQA